MIRHASLLATSVWGALALCSCAEPVPVSLWIEKSGITAFAADKWREPAVTLSVEDEAGTPQRVEVYVPLTKEWVLVESPLPVPCDDDLRCDLTLRTPPKALRFGLALSAEDHCGVRAVVATYGPVQLELQRGGPNELDFGFPVIDFDDDGDGVINLYELETCGRLDATDAAASPRRCITDDDPCCTSGNAHAEVNDGDMVVFAGGSHTLAGGSGEIIVEPFALDATEVTWRQLYRCVGGEGCLWDDLPDAVWEGLLDDDLRQMPVTGLTPLQAQEVCEFFGKRLPRDEEFDFAAANDGAGGRRIYPWGDEGMLGCVEGDQTVAANFSEPGRPCANAAEDVGSYPSSHAKRPGGTLADLAGNVPEWTLRTTLPPSGFVPVVIPEGFGGVALRGGGWRSPAVMLENDFVVAVPITDDGSDAWDTRVKELSAGAGFRCAASIEVAEAAKAATQCGEEGAP
ncbi:MAG: formylglycine-generating enzyme family protein [Myxococcota bacterium]